MVAITALGLAYRGPRNLQAFPRRAAGIQSPRTHRLLLPCDASHGCGSAPRRFACPFRVTGCKAASWAVRRWHMGISSAKRVILLAAALLSGGRWTTATGVDGAGRIVVVPLVMSDAHRESVLTLTNAGPEPLTIDALYVGATGTPLA